MSPPKQDETDGVNQRWDDLKEKKIDIKPEDKHLGLVVVMAWQAHEKWQELGLELGLDSTKMEDLRRKHDGSEKACFAEMVSTWLESCARKKLTYRNFVSALRSPRVGLESVADSMENSKCAN